MVADEPNPPIAAPNLTASVPLDSKSGKRPRREVKELHEPFRQWLNLRGIFFIYSRPDRATGTRVGLPDFVCIAKPDSPVIRDSQPRVFAIEFKASGGKLSDAQSKCHAELRSINVPVLVCFDLQSAIAFSNNCTA